jgi:hypothetical protein
VAFRGKGGKPQSRVLTPTISLPEQVQENRHALLTRRLLSRGRVVCTHSPIEFFKKYSSCVNISSQVIEKQRTIRKI